MARRSRRERVSRAHSAGSRASHSPAARRAGRDRGLPRPLHGSRALQRARRASPRLGLATTYRTLELLRSDRRCTLSRARAARRTSAAPRAPPPPRLPQLRAVDTELCATPSQRALTRRHGFKAESHELEIYGPARTASDLDRDPRGRPRGRLDLPRRNGRATPSSRADDADRTDGRRRPGVAIFSVLPEAIETVDDPALVSTLVGVQDSHLRRAIDRPPPSGRARAGPRARASGRPGRRRALRSQLRDGLGIGLRPGHDDRSLVLVAVLARLRGRTEYGRVHPQPERRPPEGDHLALHRRAGPLLGAIGRIDHGVRAGHSGISSPSTWASSSWERRTSCPRRTGIRRGPGGADRGRVRRDLRRRDAGRD